MKYDYENENYTPSLWVAEGVTSYYQNLILCRAGIMSQGELIGMLGRNIQSLQAKDGRSIQSLRDSSHDAWVKFYRQEVNSDITQVSYYNKGAVAAFLLDGNIRLKSEGKYSMDDVLRKLYQKYSGDVGFTPADFRSLCSDLAGADLSEFFRVTIDSTEELDYQPAADGFGLRIGDYIPGRERNTRESRTRQTPWLGVRTSSDSGRLTVSSVSPDSPATEAGLGYDDEIIAINNLRTISSLERRLALFDVGEQVTLLIARDGKLLELPVTIGSQGSENWSLRIHTSSSDDQQQRREDWLTRSEPLQSEEDVAEDFLEFWGGK